MSTPQLPATLAEFAKEAAPLPSLAGIFVGDPEDITARNEAAFDEVALRQRILVDITKRDLSVDVLGKRISLPVMLTPSSGHRRYTPEGELATVRAAGAAGTLFAPAMVTDFSLEEIAAEASGPIWFQTYILKNREIVEVLVKRAERAGYNGIVLTVDVPSRQLPEFGPDHRVDPAQVPYGNLKTIDLPGVPIPTTWLPSRGAPFTWDDVVWFRSLTKLPIVLKGVQTAEDAALCVEHGIDAVVVSNHGGFALAGAEASLHRLPEVVAAAGGKLEVYLDSGVRRGTDVIKALALGARAVLIGRPVIWGLAVGGQAGVERVLAVIREEIDAAMASCGLTSLRGVPREMVTTVLPTGLRAQLVDQLIELARLVDKGQLRPDEFASLKVQLLAGVR
jgi:4-hydroxymandelate oxidase